MLMLVGLISCSTTDGRVTGKMGTLNFVNLDSTNDRIDKAKWVIGGNALTLDKHA
jgi:hypothetical protein